MIYLAAVTFLASAIWSFSVSGASTLKTWGVIESHVTEHPAFFGVFLIAIPPFGVFGYCLAANSFFRQLFGDRIKKPTLIIRHQLTLFCALYLGHLLGVVARELPTPDWNVYTLGLFSTYVTSLCILAIRTHLFTRP